MEASSRFISSVDIVGHKVEPIKRRVNLVELIASKRLSSSRAGNGQQQLIASRARGLSFNGSAEVLKE
jgi:hypothetical protein